MPLETDLLCSLQDLKKVNKARMLALLKSNWLFFLLIFVGIPTIISVQDLMRGDKGAIFTWVTSPFLLLLALFIATEMSTKMVFKKNKTQGNMHIHYTFFNEEFQMETALIKNMIRYDALRGITEDRNYFFLKLSSSKILVVQKQNCSPELISFLQEKAAVIKSKGKR
ncbi:YcxB family protein [Butyrivibrio sp. WCD3002]|uniref:YcxB family protein n=1 Tax=Butyrivibrio sp. WCD3002 TaxID=1280676 RepID=UPI000427C4C2|nr:YcxB family protein [Butyrivibrio sp. WCD3002]